jgi:hypothetical protein
MKMLFSKALETTSKTSDVLATVSAFFQENSLSWGKLS